MLALGPLGVPFVPGRAGAALLVGEALDLGIATLPAVSEDPTESVDVCDDGKTSAESDSPKSKTGYEFCAWAEVGVDVTLASEPRFPFSSSCKRFSDSDRRRDLQRD